jgi:DNA (cytosine-5)-methyltransferase 1
MVRAAEVFEPLVVMIENVPSVRHSKPDVVTTARKCFEDAGYAVADAVVRMDKLGVPQSRKRHLLLAVAERVGVGPQDVLGALNPASPTVRNLEWAIGDLKDITDGTGFDAAPTCSPANLARMKWMLQEKTYDLPNDRRPKCHQDDHSYKSMYGRMHWDRPAQTITSGFTSIGQGRYMHPDHPRALTAHEAARVQSFPDYFDFSSVTKRTQLATMIGNAVPPPLAKAVFEQVLQHLRLPSVRESGLG